MGCGPNDLLEFLASRRSIRKFKHIVPSRDVVKKILDVARYAPSAGNLQPWTFVIITDSAIKAALAKLHQGAAPLEEAPLAIVIACDKELAPISYMLDCANVSLYVMLAAHALGLGSVWVQALKDVPKIQKLVRLPRHLIPVSIIALGYPAESPQPKDKKRLDELAFENFYGAPFQ